MLLSNIKKEYPSTVKILNYHKSFTIEAPQCTPHNSVACQQCWPRGKKDFPPLSSLQRSKTLISDYVLCNEFDMFATFTYDPKKVDSFDYSHAKKVMSHWLNNQKRPHKSPNLAYLIVAESHKSGAIHFHALMKGYQGKLTYAKLHKGRKIYNIDEWGWGFSTVARIDNVEIVASYVKKYISKDMLKITNKKRFWVSRNLNKPLKTYNIDMEVEVHDRPLFVVDKYRADNFTIYKVLK